MRIPSLAGRRLAPSRFETFGWDCRFKLLGPQSYDVVLAIALAVRITAPC